MAKPVIKFSAVPYEIGGKKGLRPQLEAQSPVADIDFCTEIVNEKRLSMSPSELLHAVEMVGEVGPAKVAQDGRPRVITKLLKYNRFAKGNLDSPTSPWNGTCKAYIRPQLMSEVEKTIDGTFVNVSEGIGVKLNYVAWLGARSVINVVKTGQQIGVYGNHMEFIGGDSATLTVGETVHALTNRESDVAHALFDWPEGLAPEAGTQALLEMKSRGGIEGGQVYTTRKTVTIIAGDTPPRRTVGFDGLEADVDGDGTLNVSVGGSNLEGILGYNRVPDGQDDFTAGVKVEDRDLGSVRFAGNGDGTFSAFVPNAGAYAGETLTLSAAVDGSGYEPDVVEASAVIEGA